ncbi:TIGR01777 family oxidoreductase [Rhodococcus aerolatus]
MKVVVAGGTGALGRPLCDHLAERGHEVVVLTRDPRPHVHRQVGWDGRTVGGWADELAGAAVVNLCGGLVDGRPTAENVARARASVVDPTRALATAAAALDEPVPVWLQASTLAVHGDAGDTEVDETTPPADGPPQLAGVARAWEQAAADVAATRTVLLRTATVLDVGAPALEHVVELTLRGRGGRIGSGAQWVSWVHAEDWVAVAHRALTDPGLSGPLVVAAPGPVRNAELMAALRARLGRRLALPTPAALVRVAARFEHTDPARTLGGCRAVPRALLAHGVEFRFPDLDAALDDLVGPAPGR